AMAVDPSGTNVLYIGIRGSGIFRTGNGGENWTYIGSNLIDLYVNGIGVSNSNADVIYIATRDSGVYKTTDGGTNWTQVLTGKIDSGSFTNKQLIDLVIDPKNDDNVFVADMRTGVYQTTDGGTNWELIDNGLTNRSVNCLAISSDGTVVYAGTNGGGVFVLGTPTGLEDNLEFSNYDLQIYPNPFSNNTTVHYSLSKESNVILRVFSINGELVKIIDEGNKPQGAHNYYLSSGDLPPGSYLIQLTTQEGASETKKIILTK
ncbi:MAG: T9SS type A sorting domain-containing protein, partial [Bacteroidia bacterium]|nr:T9SS type A sorting domain-containing protein [Bacteroidia bacterium]